MTFTHFPVEFTKRGRIFDPTQVDALLAGLSACTDLFVVSHGWNNDVEDATELYDKLFQSMSQVLGADVVPDVAGRNFGVVRIFWPSKKFTSEELIPGGGAASAIQENHDALLAVLEELKRDPERLGGDDRDPDREARLTQAQALVPRLESDPNARIEYVQLLRSVLDPSEAHLDDGSMEFFHRDPLDLFAELDEPVVAPRATGGGGATSVGDAGGAAGFFSDLLDGVTAAARRLANFTTYYQMKERAGIIGRTGVHEMLQQIRQRKPDIKLHLIGHSFGGRLVTAAAEALAPNTADVTMTLLQAAYSHNGIAKDFDGEHDGFYRKLISQQRISGPILITHTKNDQAVGIAYPLASRIANQKAAALGDQDDPYGGMGRNGAQHTPETENVPGGLQEVGGPYIFTHSKVFNLTADRFIKDHSDVTGPQVAYALLHAVRMI
jgi:thioesterase domain-containing protein